MAIVLYVHTRLREARQLREFQSARLTRAPVARD
jgi:hypothetical protein